MSGDVIKEFLVSLGYKLDESGHRRFTESIASTTKQVVALGVAIEATAVALVGMVHRVSVGFESLAYASSRVNASVSNINSFKYAISQLGGTADGAMASLEAFSRKLRENPQGQEAWLKSWGVATRDASGKMKDTTDLMKGLVGSKKFQSQPEFLRLHIAEEAGIDERTYRALLLQVDKFTDEYKKKMRAAGLDPDKAAQDAKKFEQAWRSMGTSFDIIKAKVLSSFSGETGDKFQQFISYLDKNSGKIAKGLEAVGSFLMTAAEWMAKLLIKIGEFVEKADPWIEKNFGITNGFEKLAAVLLLLYVTRIPALIAALGTLVGGPAFKALMGFFGVMGLTGLAGAAAVGGGVAALSTEEGQDAYKDIKQKSERNMRRGGGFWKRMKGAVFGEDTTKGAHTEDAARRGNKFKLSSSQSAEMASGIKQIAKELGVSAEDVAAVISFETGGTMNPWKKGPTTKWGQHRGLIQWGEPQRKQYGVTQNSTITEQLQAVKKYMYDRGVRPGMSREEVYASVLAGHAKNVNSGPDANGTTPRSGAARMWNSGHRWALQNLERGARGSQGTSVAPQAPGGAPGASPFGSLAPLNPLGHSSAGGSSMINNFHNNQTYNVDGARDPGATARAIGGIQATTNADAIRNMQGSAR